jgi:subtilase family serine protease
VSYRQYLTVEEFTARYGPSQEDYDAVIRFAEANGLTVVGTSRNRRNVDLTGTVANIEKAFHVTMGLFMQPTETELFMPRTASPPSTCRSLYGTSWGWTTIRSRIQRASNVETRTRNRTLRPVLGLRPLFWAASKASAFAVEPVSRETAGDWSRSA